LRIILPTLSSQRIGFSQRFQNLNYVYGSNARIVGSVSVDNKLDVTSGGYLIYGGADTFSTLPWFTIYAKVTVLADSTKRVVAACGHPSIGDKFEIGVDSSNQMYFTSGSTYVSDDTISSGTHNLLWIFNGSDLELWMDGVRIGSSTATLSSNVSPTFYVGAATDGGDGWGSVINEVRIYNYPLDEEEAFLVSGIEGWTPKDLLTDYGGTFGYDNGLYWDGDVDGAYDLNTQPTLVDGLMLQPNANAWAPLTVNNIPMMQAGGPHGRYLQVDNAVSSPSVYQSAIMLAGNQYAYDFDALGIANFWLGSSIVQSVNTTAWTRFAGDATCATLGNLRLYGAGGAGTTVKWARIILRNLSCKALNIYGSGTLAGSKFEQATAANMPWKSSDGLGVRGDGADYSISSASAAAWDGFTTAAGGSILFEVSPAVDGTYMAIMGNCDGPASTGFMCRRAASNAMQFSAMNSSGAWVMVNRGGGSLVTGSNYVVEFYHDGANHYTALLNGTLILNYAGIGDVSTVPPVNPMVLMAQAAYASPWNGSVRRIFYGPKLSPTDQARAVDYFKRAAR